MLAKKYKSEVISISNPLKDVYTVEFRSLGRKYKYQPGQFLHLTIDKSYDGIGQWPESRCFSMQSSPYEDNIKITYSVKGKYTSLLKDELKTGSVVWLKLPYGDLFSQAHNKENTVFIAGGTGITPFLSLFNSTQFVEYIKPKIYLGFRSKEYNIYDESLSGIQNSDSEITIKYENNNGKLDIDEILKKNSINSSFYISGPPQMIRDLKNFLLENNVDQSRILTDDWE